MYKKLSKVKYISESKPFNNKKSKKDKTTPIFMIISIIVGFFIGAIIILLLGNSVALYFTDLWNANFSSWYTFGNLLGTWTWIYLLGASMMVSFKSKVFNIGGAGQMILGAIFAYLFAINVNIGRFGMVIVILISTVTGMLLSALVATLKIKFGVHEVISGILLNWIIYFLLFYITTQVPSLLNNTGRSLIPILSVNSLQAGWISNMFGGSQLINWGFFIALILSIGFIFSYKKTSWGLKQEILGSSNNLPNYVGINRNREIFKILLISGAIAGFAGAVYYCGYQLQLQQPTTVSLPYNTFQGFRVAMIGLNSPIGIIFSSTFIALFRNASDLISTSGTSPYVTNLIFGIITLFIATIGFFIIYKPHLKIFNKRLIKENNLKQDKLEFRNNDEIDNLLFKTFELTMENPTIMNKKRTLILINNSMLIGLISYKKAKKMYKQLNSLPTMISKDKLDLLVERFGGKN